MKDLIAKLKSDACMAMGGIWLHIDAREARIAELETKLQEQDAMLGRRPCQDDRCVKMAELEAENTNLRYELNAALSGGTVSVPGTQIAVEPVAQVAEDCVFLLRKQPNGDRWPVGTKLYTASTAVQAPVREVPEPEGWREAMQEFVDRCERGEILSRYTYSKFKALLAPLPADPVQQEG